VSDRDRRPLERCHHLIERRLHDAFGLVVEGGRRLVKQQHGWLSHESPRDRHPLLLSA
jgi:hypothetical protein